MLSGQVLLFFTVSCSLALYLGYCGELTFGLKNHSKYNDFILELGARITQIIFHENTENISEYRGQWQGGKVSTQGQIETQV